MSKTDKNIARLNRRKCRRKAIAICKRKLSTLETDHIEIARRVAFNLGLEFKSKDHKSIDRLLTMYSGVIISSETKSKKKYPDSFYASDAWRKLRYKALKLYGRQCACCGAKPPQVVLHVDHIKPRSTHPELELDIKNLQILCEDCNLGKSNTDCIDYRP